MTIKTSPPPRFNIPSSHTSSITIFLSPFISYYTRLRPDVTAGDEVTQRSYNHLKHYHNNNERNNNNNNTVSTTQEKCISSPHSSINGILCKNVVSKSPGFYFSAFYLSRNYLSVLRILLDVVLN